MGENFQAERHLKARESYFRPSGKVTGRESHLKSIGDFRHGEFSGERISNLTARVFFSRELQLRIL